MWLYIRAFWQFLFNYRLSTFHLHPSSNSNTSDTYFVKTFSLIWNFHKPISCDQILWICTINFSYLFQDLFYSQNRHVFLYFHCIESSAMTLQLLFKFMYKKCRSPFWEKNLSDRESHFFVLERILLVTKLFSDH